MLAAILDYLHPDAFRKGLISVSNVDGKDKITTWKVPGVEKPTEESILAREAEWRQTKNAAAPWDRAEAALGKQRQKVLAAVIVRLSSSWAGLTAQEKARVTAVLDAAGQRIVEAIRG